MDPIAQGEPTSQPAQQPDNSQAEGIQKRINELVAERNEARGTITAMQQQITSMNEMFLRQSQAPAQVQQQVPAVDVDPQIAAQVQALMGPTLKQYEQTIQQQQATLNRIQYENELQKVPEAIRARAQQLQQQWTAARHTGWTMQDAIRYAAGEAAMNGQFVTQPRDSRGQFNSMANSVMGQTSAPPTTTPPSNELPSNFDDLQPDKQIELLGKRLEGKTF
jgi:chromosome segregation ATPase